MTSRTSLFGFLHLSAAFVICKGLDSLLPVSEITVPQRLLGRAVENTDSIIYKITIGGKTHFVYLVRQIFLPTDFAIYINGKEDTSEYYHHQMKMGCYYQGFVLDHPNSAATLRTCSGLRGLLEFLNESYAIEPLQFLHGFKHLVSKLKEESKYIYILENDTDQESMEQKQEKMSSMLDSAKQVNVAVQTPYYMKLAVFVTKELFDSNSASVSAVNEKMFKMISLLNTRFTRLNVHIFMVSLDIWTESNPIDMSNGTVAEKLSRFISFTKSIAFKRRPYDIPLLISVDGDVGFGLTSFGSICSPQSGALAVFSGTIEKCSSAVAHLLGHSIGLGHDNFRNCKCSGAVCLMHTDMGISMGVQTFSSCSIEDFEKFVLTSGASCLLNLPNLQRTVNPALCGNKLVDEGEACDCGSASECQADPCCDMSCKLKGKAECAWGQCCNNCKFLPKGTQCREPADECDLPEYCNGISPTCVGDIFQQNGNSCKNNQSYCYQGKCADRDARCKQYFGSGSKAADPLCYLEANVLKDRFGNCGVGDQGDYIGCPVLGTFCGKLQCTYQSNLPISDSKGAIMYYAPKSSLCVSIDLTQKANVADPALVPDGTKCGDDKICIGQKCVNLTSLNNKCSSEVTCNSHGVCNSKGNCHCKKGWEPPTCTEFGNGGSVDSGSRIRLLTERSAPVDTSLIKWLLIGFGIFIPLVSITLVLVLKRKSLRKLCKKTDETYGSEEETETDTFPTASVTS
ncbi:disintegrin and metalloproteinase domain-containing protein 9-like [Ambystoma mexicanum]|uniref:disintegrin and metalloproteinase domain-containing protein 9-like n=1 Tax=Ambystoma mexicanum TaxID=8296 RepID=UPI0037E763EF